MQNNSVQNNSVSVLSKCVYANNIKYKQATHVNLYSTALIIQVYTTNNIILKHRN